VHVAVRAETLVPETLVTSERQVIHADGGFAVEAADGGMITTLEPPRLISPASPRYPADLPERIAGDVGLELLIDETGAVKEARISQPLSPALDAAAVQAAASLRFKPGLLAGTPAPTRIHFMFHFSPPPLPETRARLTGIVRTQGTRLNLAGAHLVAADGSAAETDNAGHFTLALPAGRSELTVSAEGCRQGRFVETLTGGQSADVVYALEPIVARPYQVTIKGDRPRTEVSRVVLQDQELREVPGTMGDPFRVVMLLPGVGDLASGVSYPIVRGTEPAATGYFIDGVNVPSLYHLVLGPAVVHPDFIDSVTFYPGPVPVQYGRLMGGAVDGTVARTRDDRIHATAYADLINAGALVEVPLPQTGTNITVAGRGSYAGWLLSAAAPLFRQPDGTKITPSANLYDYQLRVDQSVGAGRLRLLALGSSDVVGETTATPGLPTSGADVSTIFHRVDLRYRSPLPLGRFEAGITYGYQQTGLDERQSGQIERSYQLTENILSGRASWEAAPARGWDVSAGVALEYRRSGTSGVSLVNGSSTETASFSPPLTQTLLSGVWAQATWRPDKRWTITPGIRADEYHLLPQGDFASVDPRLSVLFGVRDDLLLKAGISSVHQPPTILLTLPVLDAAALKYGLQSGMQVEAGIEWRAPFGFELAASGYYDPIFRAVELNLNDVLTDAQRLSLPGYDPGVPGRAYGFELLLRHPLGGHWFGWISYAYQRAERYQTYAVLDSHSTAIGTATGWVPFAFQQAHVLNVAVSYQFPFNIVAGAVFHFNTGRPETGQLSSRTEVPGTDAATGAPAWVYVNRNQVADLPPFYRVDVRFSKTWIKRDYLLELYLDILNVTLSEEVLEFIYTVDPTGSLQKRAVGLPVVVPMLGLKATY
jgi:TonB family protein